MHLSLSPSLSFQENKSIVFQSFRFNFVDLHLDKGYKKFTYFNKCQKYCKIKITNVYIAKRCDYMIIHLS